MEAFLLGGVRYIKGDFPRGDVDIWRPKGQSEDCKFTPGVSGHLETIGEPTFSDRNQKHHEVCGISGRGENNVFSDTCGTLLLLQSLVLWFSQGLTLRIRAGIN